MATAANGTRSKTGLIEIGPVEIEVPGIVTAVSTPQTPRRGQRRLDGVDSMVVSLTAKGLTTGEVEVHLAEVWPRSHGRCAVPCGTAQPPDLSPGNVVHHRHTRRVLDDTNLERPERSALEERGLQRRCASTTKHRIDHHGNVEAGSRAGCPCGSHPRPMTQIAEGVG